MKQSFIIILMLVFISCNNNPTSVSANTYSIIQKNLSLSAALFKAVETGNRAALDTLIANDMIDHNGVNNKLTTNADSVRTMLADSRKSLKDFKIKIITAAANDDYVFTYEDVTGEFLDSSKKKPEWKPMHNNPVDLVKIKNGKIVEHWEFENSNKIEN